MTNAANDSARLPNLTRLWPGVALSAALAAFALGMGSAQHWLFGRAWVDALVIAILLGAALNSIRPLPARFQPGIAFSAKILLEVAVMLIGANISAAAVFAAGWPLLAGIAAVVALSLVLGYGISHALGLNPRLSLLIAAGNSICGNSAIAAVAPVIGADARDVAASVAFTAILGVIVVVLLPILAVAWAMPAQSFGIFAGLTVYAVPQVLAATAPISSFSAQIGTFVKLIRVLMLGPLMVVISLFARRDRPGHTGLDLAHIIPWFIVGFLVMMALRSLGLIPEALLPWITYAATLLTLMAMAALGLGVDIRDIASAGPRVIAAVTLSIIALGALALGMIKVLGLG